MSEQSTIFTRFWHWLTGEVKQLPPLEHNIALFSNTVTNDIKAFTSSELFVYLESGIVAVAQAIDPAIVPLIQGIENYIPKAVALIGGVNTVISTEAGKTLAQQAQDGLTAIQSTKAADAVVYAGNLGTLAAAVSNYVLSNNAVETGIISPDAGTLLSVQQAVHSNTF